MRLAHHFLFPGGSGNVSDLLVYILSQTLFDPRSRPTDRQMSSGSFLSLSFLFFPVDIAAVGRRSTKDFTAYEFCELTTICNLFEEFSASVSSLGAFTDLASWCGWSSRLVASLTVRYRVLSVWGCSYFLLVFLLFSFFCLVCGFYFCLRSSSASTKKKTTTFLSFKIKAKTPSCTCAEGQTGARGPSEPPTPLPPPQMPSV